METPCFHSKSSSGLVVVAGIVIFVDLGVCFKCYFYGVVFKTGTTHYNSGGTNLSGDNFPTGIEFSWVIVIITIPLIIILTISLNSRSFAV